MTECLERIDVSGCGECEIYAGVDRRALIEP